MKMRQTNEFKKIMRHIAYDYDPFGMLMPNRYTEDNTIQCTPITKTVYTPQWINTLSLTLANPAEISAFDIFPASTTASIILTQQKLKVVASTSYADISQVSILVSNGVEAFKPVKLQCSVSNNNLADYVSVSLQQENANNEWETFASTTVAKNDTLELTGTPTSNTALKVVYEGIHADFNIGNIGLQRQDMLSSTEIVQICNSDEFSRDYRFGFNGQEKVNEIAGIGNHNTALFWEYDTRLGRRWNVDPKISLKPNQSSYSTFSGNPVWFNDILGDLESTHTDDEGNVVAVINDGDKGVYKHGNNADGSKPTGYQIKRRQEIYGNTSANGEKMGETWTDFGFADFGAYETDGTLTPATGARIDFSSNWATNKFQGLINDNPTLGSYGLNAGTGGKYDFKSKVPKGETPAFGSLLFGKYASARDAGNMGAGFVAERSIVPTKVSDYGFGKYNQTGNSKLKTAWEIYGDICDMFVPDGTGHGQERATQSIRNSIYKGEDELSRQGINQGKLLFKLNFKR